MTERTAKVLAMHEMLENAYFNWFSKSTFRKEFPEKFYSAHE